MVNKCAFYILSVKKIILEKWVFSLLIERVTCLVTLRNLSISDGALRLSSADSLFSTL